MVGQCIEDYGGGGFSFNLNNDLGGGMPEVIHGGADLTVDSISMDFPSLSGGGKKGRRKKRRTGKIKRSNRSRIHGRSKKPKSRSKLNPNYNKSKSKSKYRKVHKKLSKSLRKKSKKSKSLK